METSCTFYQRAYPATTWGGPRTDIYFPPNQHDSPIKPLRPPSRIYRIDRIRDEWLCNAGGRSGRVLPKCHSAGLGRAGGLQTGRAAIRRRVLALLSTAV